MRSLSIILALAVGISLYGCGPVLKEMAVNQAETNEGAAAYADEIAEGWGLFSGLLQRLLSKTEAPPWIFTNLKEIDAYIDALEKNDEGKPDLSKLTDRQKGEMVGTVIRVSGPSFRSVIEDYAPGILNFSEVLPVLAFLGL